MGDGGWGMGDRGIGGSGDQGIRESGDQGIRIRIRPAKPGLLVYFLEFKKILC